jgi:hypothetical protein
MEGRMPTECFIPKDFRVGTRAIIRKANTLIADYQRQGYKLTLRQLYYQFVQRNWLVNKQSEYKRLGEILNDARLAGLVDWDAIEDRGRNLAPTPMWGDPGDPLSPGQFIADWGRHFKNDPWVNQPSYVEVWIEKEALVGVIERPCRRWRVPYFACKGYVSASEMYDAAYRLAGFAETGQEVTVIHLGDHDPSGTQMSDNIAERLALLSREIEGITVKRVALTMEQINQYNPPPNPAKESDSRYLEYVRRYNTTSSWELDSMQPSVIDALVEEEISMLVDHELWDRDIDAEKEPYRLLMESGRRWPEVTSMLMRDPDTARERYDDTEE